MNGSLPLKIPDFKYSFFLRLTKFQQCMFRKFHWILICSNSLTKIPYNKSLYVEVHCTIIEYGNRKVKPTHYLIQIIDLDNSNDQRQEWFSE